MPIQVICPGCQTRFKVSDKYAGQKGGCPKCKAVILVPKIKNEEVVIHEPDHSEFGARNAQGVSTLKPLERVETEIQPLAVVGLVGTCLLSLVVALAMRMGEGPPTFILYFGAIAIGPPVCWAGYFFLRDDEQMESFTGASLWIRTAICSLGYALLWAVFTYVYWRLVGSEPVEVWNIALLGPPFLMLGAGIAYCCYDLDLGSGFFHYALYLLATILLRLVMGLPAVGPAGM